MHIIKLIHLKTNNGKVWHCGAADWLMLLWKLDRESVSSLLQGQSCK